MEDLSFDKKAIEKAIFPKYKVWLYRLMWWKYREITDGIFINK